MAIARTVRFLEGMFGLRKLTLEGVGERARVHVVGTLASDNNVASEVSPVTAAILRWALLHRRVVRDAAGHSLGSHPEESFRVYSERTRRHDLVVKTAHGSLHLPANLPLRVVFATPIELNPVPLVSKPPAEMLELIAADRSKFELYFNERYISKGDRIALKALIEPSRGGAGPYRGIEAKADFTVLADEPCTIREL